MPLLLRPWSDVPRLWRSLAYLAVGVPLGIVSFTSVFTLTVLTFSLLITVVLAIPAAWGLFIAARILGSIDRSRSAALLGLELVDPVPPLQGRNWFKRLWERVRTRSRWREIINAFLLFPVSLACWMTTVTTWAGSVALLAMPIYVVHLPGGTAKFWLFEIGPGPGALAMTGVGLLGLIAVAPWVTIGATNLQSGMTRFLLGRTTEAEMAKLLQRAEAQRTSAVDSAETERRRIERDLHDGAQ
ncbi:MAG: sensor domain-containing protein, partial [Aquihabitans sp.]